MKNALYVTIQISCNVIILLRVLSIFTTIKFVAMQTLKNINLANFKFHIFY